MNTKFEKMLEKAVVVSVDVDGTLCSGTCWTPEDCLNAIPRKDIIEKVNKLAQTKYIIIWTSRRDNLIPATLQWLRANGVQFQAITNNKSASDLYIDDKTLDVEDL